jgi:hypothetical protein
MSDSLELPVNPRFGTPDVTVCRLTESPSSNHVSAAWRGCVWQWPIRLRAALRLGDDSRILLFGTEGVTDRVTHNHVLCSRQS